MTFDEDQLFFVSDFGFVARAEPDGALPRETDGRRMTLVFLHMRDAIPPQELFWASVTPEMIERNPARFFGSELIDIIRDEDLLTNCRAQSEVLFSYREQLLAHPTVRDVRGWGLMMVLEFIKDKETLEFFDQSPRYSTPPSRSSKGWSCTALCMARADRAHSNEAFPHGCLRL